MAGIDTSSSESIAKALASMDANIGWMDDDYVQTIDQDTIIYDSEFQTLTKVTGGDLEYSSSNDVFDPNVAQQVRAQVYVNFKKRTIFAEVDTKVTRTGTSDEIEIGWNTGTASFSSLPVVATADQRLKKDGTSHDVPLEPTLMLQVHLVL